MGKKLLSYVRSTTKVHDDVKIKAMVDGKQVEGQYLDSNMRPMTTTRELNDQEVALWVIDFYISYHKKLIMPDHINKIIINILQEDLKTEENVLDKLLEMLDWEMQNNQSSEFERRRQKYQRRF